MNYYDISLIAVALAMDASTIAISNCTAYKDSLTRKKEFAMPILFAFFQALMPLIGFFVGNIFSSFLEQIAGYLSSAIFLLLSGKIVYDIIKEKNESGCTIKEQEKQKHAILTFSVLILQGVATSIDALIVGITLVNLNFNILIAISIICFITFIMVWLAVIFGKKIGNVFGNYAEWVGAILLFILAIKSFLQTIL